MKKLVVKISRKKFSNNLSVILSFTSYSFNILKDCIWDELWFQPILWLMVSQLHIILFNSFSWGEDFHLFRSRILKMLKHFIHLWFCPKRIICFLSVNKTLYFRACFLQYIQFLRCWRHALGRIIPYLVCVRPHLTQSITLTKVLSLQYEKKGKIFSCTKRPQTEVSYLFRMKNIWFLKHC